MTIGEALASSGLDPREARLLLAHASGLSEAGVLAHGDRVLPDGHRARFMEAAARRRKGEPVAYIVGEKEFYGLRLAVSPAVLIPRAETELLVDLALQSEFSSALDLGTGSGALALAIKRQRPAARVVAVDDSAVALVMAQRNGTTLGLQVDWRHGDWFDAVPGERFDLIVANPPYVAMGDPHLADLRYEPAAALVAGVDGLEAMRCIVPGAREHLEQGGWLLVEHGMGQDAAVRSLMQASGLEAVQTWPDLAGIGRVTGGRA